MKNNAVTDQEKREKKIVVKKLAEMEEELKVRVCINVTKFGTQYYWNYFQLLALSENLTDQVRSLLSFHYSQLEKLEAARSAYLWLPFLALLSLSRPS